MVWACRCFLFVVSCRCLVACQLGWSLSAACTPAKSDHAWTNVARRAGPAASWSISRFLERV